MIVDMFEVCLAKFRLFWKDAEGLVNFHWATQGRILGTSQCLKLVLGNLHGSVRTIFLTSKRAQDTAKTEPKLRPLVSSIAKKMFRERRKLSKLISLKKHIKLCTSLGKAAIGDMPVTYVLNLKKSILYFGT